MIHEPQKKFEECKHKNKLPFDVYAGDKLLIEYDGQGHFNAVNFGGISDSEAIQNHLVRKQNDRIKNRYCIDNNIPLIRIPYWELNNIEPILESVLMHYDIITRTDSYDYSLIAEWIVDANSNHDEYIAKCPKNMKDVLKHIS